MCYFTALVGSCHRPPHTLTNWPTVSEHLVCTNPIHSIWWGEQRPDAAWHEAKFHSRYCRNLNRIRSNLRSTYKERGQSLGIRTPLRKKDQFVGDDLLWLPSKQEKVGIRRLVTVPNLARISCAKVIPVDVNFAWVPIFAPLLSYPSYLIPANGTALGHFNSLTSLDPALARTVGVTNRCVP